MRNPFAKDNSQVSTYKQLLIDSGKYTKESVEEIKEELLASKVQALVKGGDPTKKNSALTPELQAELEKEVKAAGADTAQFVKAVAILKAEKVSVDGKGGVKALVANVIEAYAKLPAEKQTALDSEPAKSNDPAKATDPVTDPLKQADPKLGEQPDIWKQITEPAQSKGQQVVQETNPDGTPIIRNVDKGNIDLSFMLDLGADELATDKFTDAEMRNIGFDGGETLAAIYFEEPLETDIKIRDRNLAADSAGKRSRLAA